MNPASRRVARQLAPAGAFTGPVRHLYVHVPFCRRRCTYCDFSIAVRRTVPVAEYLAALSSEWASVAPATPLQTVYLGGGTPSLLGGDGVVALASCLAVGRDVAEFTIEANPDDVTPAAAAAWVRAGVNRLSLGAQSFDDGVLSWMHRTHDAAAIGAAVAAARRADRVECGPPRSDRTARCGRARGPGRGRGHRPGGGPAPAAARR